VISPDVRIEGFDARSWTNLLSLFAPGVVERIERDPASSEAPEVHPEPAEKRTGTLVLRVSAEHRVRKAFHSERGRIRGLEYLGPESLPRLHEEFRARRTIALLDGAVEEVGERVAARVQLNDKYLSQCLVLFRAIAEVQDEGLIHVWPRPRVQVPLPTGGMIQRALDTLLPNDTTLSMMIWNGNVPWTALVLRRRNGLIDLIAGPDWVGRWSGPLGGDWRRDHRFVSDGVSRSVAPVHIGLYAQLDDVRRLLRSAEPGAWASAVAMREIVVSPMPAYVAVALGADVARAAAQKTTEWLQGIDALSQLGPIVGYVRGRVTEIASITQTLGFDPLQALAHSLRARETSEAERRDEGPDETS
jgi:hypothetical protein